MTSAIYSLSRTIAFGTCCTVSRVTGDLSYASLFLTGLVAAGAMTDLYNTFSSQEVNDLDAFLGKVNPNRVAVQALVIACGTFTYVALNKISTISEDCARSISDSAIKQLRSKDFTSTVLKPHYN